MTEFSIKHEIENFLDSVFVISHSTSSVRVYRSGINHFAKFTQIKYEKSLEQVISSMKDDSMDRYNVFKDFVIYLDKAGKKPSSIKICFISKDIIVT
jgi:hypothetical protein